MPKWSWYLVTFTKSGRVVERGWMMAETDGELIEYAQTSGFGIDIYYLGPVDWNSVLPAVTDEFKPRVESLLASVS